MNSKFIVLLSCFLVINANCQEFESIQSKFQVLPSTQAISIGLESCKKIEEAGKISEVIVGSAAFQEFKQKYLPLLPLMTKENLEFCEKLKKANDVPRIEINYTIILSSAMEKALKDYDLGFRILPSKHFHPYTFASCKFGNTDYASKYYRILGSPSAIIGDFNSDDKLDIAIIGYKKKPKGVMEYKPSKRFLKTLLILVSEQGRYKVFDRNIGELPENFDPQQPSMDLYRIEVVKKREKVTNCAGENLELKADGIRIRDTEKGDGGLILYYENHEMNSFLLCYNRL